MNINELPNARAVFVHDDLEAMSATVARRISELASSAISQRGIFRIALAGGETPRRCYEKLRDLSVDWAHVHIYFGDERCLPIGDVNRNDSMVREILLKHINIRTANVNAISAELGANKAAAIYSSLLNQIVPLDLVLLGMGDDGHTASLFPNNLAIENNAAAVPVFNAPKLPAERVSLGLKTLNSAKHKIFLVAGEGKRAALKQILLGNFLPAALVTSTEWHLDSAATQGL
jgi:6-phosphogluconolactonase